MSTCVLDGCDRKVDARWCVCGEHWRVLPEDLRAQLSRAYSPTRTLDEQGHGFYVARAKVQGWIRKTFGAEPERSRPSWDRLVAWVRERDAARGRVTAPAAKVPEDELQPAQLRLVE